jgi:hypothetical protein
MPEQWHWSPKPHNSFTRPHNTWMKALWTWRVWIPELQPYLCAYQQFTRFRGRRANREEFSGFPRTAAQEASARSRRAARVLSSASAPHGGCGLVRGTRRIESSAQAGTESREVESYRGPRTNASLAYTVFLVVVGVWCVGSKGKESICRKAEG